MGRTLKYQKISSHTGHTITQSPPPHAPHSHHNYSPVSWTFHLPCWLCARLDTRLRTLNCPIQLSLDQFEAPVDKTIKFFRRPVFKCNFWATFVDQNNTMKAFFSQPKYRLKHWAACTRQLQCIHVHVSQHLTIVESSWLSRRKLCSPPSLAPSLVCKWFS